MLQRRYRNGAFAEQMLTPLENLHPLGDVTAEEAARWCAAGTMLVPYGGLLAIDFRPGEILAVSGATGNFGGAAVMLALGMGARAVIACGRNAETLAAAGTALRRRACAPSPSAATPRPIARASRPPRPALSTPCSTSCRRRAIPAATRAAMLALREFGRAALMGGQRMSWRCPTTG